MKSSNRRNFIKGCSLMVGAGCLAKVDLGAAEKAILDDELDLDELTYCAWRCSPQKCILLKATLQNDEKLKKRVYKEFKFKETDGIDFDPSLIFCYTCKEHEKEANLQVKRCDVRNCAIEKGVRSCVECQSLQTCKKDIWNRFPKQKIYALKLQKRWVEQEKQKLI